MSDTVHDIDGTTVFVCAEEGSSLGTDRDAVDLIAEAHQHHAEWLVVPVGRLADDFFTLRTGVAGAILQKFVNYRMGLAVLGDVAPYTVASETFRSFVTETNRGRQAWFVTDLDDLRAKLAKLARR